MSREMTKSHKLRLRHGDYEWMKGRVLDIGCGNDPIDLPPPSTVRGWDMPDGDAQQLVTLRDNTFDVVVSSHCLEHMRDPQVALKNWSRVLRPGGYCYILVPLYSAYEKQHDFKFGEAKFNPDHKTSWDLVSADPPKNHPHYDYKAIVTLGRNAGLALHDLRMELDGFHWDKWNDPAFDSTQEGGLAQLCVIYRKEA